MRKIKKHGFTLAEILITLSIIGVVAALTIPTLIQRTGDEELVSKYFKTYSILSQATESAITELGAPSVWTSDRNSVYNVYKKHLRFARDCGTAGGCWSYINSSSKSKNLDGTLSNYAPELECAQTTLGSAGWSMCAVLTDGVSLNIRAKNILVDINGRKEPNQWGRDLFDFIITEKGLMPGGYDTVDIDNDCNPKKSSDANSRYGRNCGAKIIAEGAMNY